MAQIKPLLEIVVDPEQPVAEACNIITALNAYHRDKEKDILIGIRDAIDRRLMELETAGKTN